MDTIDTEKRLEALEQALASQQRAAARLRRLLGVAGLTAVMGVGVLFARPAWAAGCSRTGAFAYLPGLKYFCADEPAFADDLNANTQALVTTVEQKVGTLGNSAITTSSVNTSGVVTNGLVVNNTLGFTGTGPALRQMIDLATGAGVGVQTSTQYFRSPGGFAWFRGGSHNDGQNNAGGGAVAMTLSPSSDLTVAGRLGGSSLRRTNCRWAEGPGIGADNQYHQIECNDGEYMSGWRCYANDRLDGRCALLCCSP